MAEGFAGAVDMSDPVAFANHCISLAGGMRQQAVAAQGGSALGGHPYPSFFYGQVADALEAAAAKAAPPPAPKPDPPKPEEVKPKPKVDKSNL